MMLWLTECWTFNAFADLRGIWQLLKRIQAYLQLFRRAFGCFDFERNFRSNQVKWNSWNSFCNFIKNENYSLSIQTFYEIVWRRPIGSNYMFKFSLISTGFAASFVSTVSPTDKFRSNRCSMELDSGLWVGNTRIARDWSWSIYFLECWKINRCPSLMLSVLKQFFSLKDLL